MLRNRQDEYRLSRAIAINVTLGILILLFYIFPRFELDFSPEIPVQNFQITLEVPPPIHSKRIPMPPFPTIPIEAENNESVDDEPIPEDSVMFALMEADKINPDVWNDTLHILDSLEFDYDEVDIKPKLLKYIEPEYPNLARMSMYTGKVLLKVLVNREGEVEKIHLVSGNPLFNAAAIKAGKSCRFAPGKKDGIPVKVWVQLPVIFRLE